MAGPHATQQIEVYRFNVVTAVAVPVAALLVQAFLPLIVPPFAMFDLPLLVMMYFGVARRNQITGLLTGSFIGLAQDSLTHQPIGLYGIAKTVIGYLASSLGVKIDVDNHGSRFLMTFGFYTLHQVVYYVAARFLAGQALSWRWTHEAVAALANAALAVLLFSVLDKFRQRT